MTKRVLLFTVGETPQIVTETLHALVTAPSPWWPDRIVLATTARAARQFEDGKPAFITSSGATEPSQPPLLGPNGRLCALYENLGLQGDAPELDILVPRLPTGAPIEDIRTEAQIAAFAEMLLTSIGSLSCDPDIELHVSLAGGRKTMSFIAGQVMSLYGRACDTLSHVLVEPASYETLYSFWWPGQPEAVFDRYGMSLDPAAARVELHPVPFVRLRAFLDSNDVFDKAPSGFATAVTRANAALAVDKLVVDLSNRAVSIGHWELAANPRSLAALGLIAIAKRTGAKLSVIGKDFERKPALDGDPVAALLAWARLVAAMDLAKLYDGEPQMFSLAPFRFDQEVERLMRTFDYSVDFGPPLSRLRKQLRGALPRNLAERILLPQRYLETDFPAGNIEIRLAVPLPLIEQASLSRSIHRR